MTMRAIFCLLCSLVVWSAVSGCQDPPPVPSTTTTRPSSPAKKDGGPALSPGRHQLEGKTAYAFSPGMSEPEVRALVDKAVADGHMKISEEIRDQKPGFDPKTQIDVTVLMLEQLKHPDIETIGLTLFGDRLVGLNLTYRIPVAARAMEPAKKYGPGTLGREWVGWWLPAQQLLIQTRSDGGVYEIFDLMVAKPFMPQVERKVLASWMKRYPAPPVWLQKGIEKHKLKGKP